MLGLFCRLLLRPLTRRKAARRKPAPAARRYRPRFAPGLIALDDRTVPSITPVFHQTFDLNEYDGSGTGKVEVTVSDQGDGRTLWDYVFTNLSFAGDPADPGAGGFSVWVSDADVEDVYNSLGWLTSFVPDENGVSCILWQAYVDATYTITMPVIGVGASGEFSFTTSSEDWTFGPTGAAIYDREYMWGTNFSTPSVGPVPLPVISVSGGSASEAGTDPYSVTPDNFILTRTGNTTYPLDVAVSLGSPTGTADAYATLGADYTASTTTLVHFDAGSSTATITVTPKKDNLVEGAEKVRATLLPGSDYILSTDPDARKADLTIADDPPVVTVTSTGALSEDTVNGPTGGGFVFTRTGGDLTVDLPVDYKIPGGATGVALNGIDYDPLPGTTAADPAHPELDLYGTVTIPASSSNPAPSLFVQVFVIPDGVNESSESVSVQVIPPGSSPGSTPVTPPTYSLGSPYLAVLLIADATPTIDVAVDTMIPVNANNTNYNPQGNQPRWKPGKQRWIPYKRDFDVSNLWQDDLELKPLTVTIGGGMAGTLTVSTHQSGDVVTSLWKDKRKKDSFTTINVPAGTDPYTLTLYVEGDHESDGTTDTSDQKFTFTPSVLPQRAVEKEVNLLVTPITIGFGTTVPNPSIVLWNLTDNLAGMIAVKPATATTPVQSGIEFQADFVNNYIGKLVFIQDLISDDNGANGSGAGAVYTDGSKKNSLLPIGSPASYPMLDNTGTSTLNAEAVNPEYTESRKTIFLDQAQTKVRISAADNPSTGTPGTDFTDAAKADKVDLKRNYETFVGIRFDDGSVYLIANMKWSVNFYATGNVFNKGAMTIQAASKVLVTNDWRRDNKDPLATSGIAANDAGLDWR